MAYMDEKCFKKHISSKKFNNIYVIFGDEKYLVKHYTQELVTAVAGKEPSEFAFHSFNSEADVQSVSDAICVVPFMAEYNCVLVNDMDINKLSKEQYDSFVEVLKTTPLSTVVIFSFSALASKEPSSEKKSDEKKSRNRFKTFCDMVDKLGMGAVAELNKRSATALEHQLSVWADKVGKKLSLPVASRIIYYCGTDLATLRLELDKVCAFAGDSDEITLDMVETTVVKKLEARVYELTDNVIFCNAEKAYTQLYQLFAQREDVHDILWVLGQAYVDLYRARVTTTSGEMMNETAEFFNYGKRAWVLTKAPGKSRKLSTNALRESLSAIVNLNEKLNSVSINEEAALEKLIADLMLIAKKELDYA